MNKFSINDWLTIQTRKDLTFIKRIIERESVGYAIFADMFIAILTFVLDHVFWTVVDPNTGAREQAAPSWYWVLTAVLLIIAPVVIFYLGARKKARFQDDIKKVMPIELLIDLFDNEICYNAMTADLMRDHMKDQGNEIEDEIRAFYIIEAAYYANKAISQLFYFKNHGKNGIQTSNSHGGISYTRFNNVCRIVSNVYRDLSDYTTQNTVFKPLLEDSKEYIVMFNDLLTHIGRLIPELKDLTNYKINLFQN